jgi:hypothetical protein
VVIKNVPTVNGRAIFLSLLTIALVIVAPIGHGWAQGAEPELITFTSGELALTGFIWKPEGPGPFPAIVWNHAAKSFRAPLIPPPHISLVGVTSFLSPTPEVRGGHPAPTAWIS